MYIISWYYNVAVSLINFVIHTTVVEITVVPQYCDLLNVREKYKQKGIDPLLLGTLIFRSGQQFIFFVFPHGFVIVM